MTFRTPKKVVATKSTNNGDDDPLENVDDLISGLSPNSKLEVYNSVKNKVSVLRAKRKCTVYDVSFEIKKAFRQSLSKNGEIGNRFLSFARVLKNLRSQLDGLSTELLSLSEKYNDLHKEVSLMKKNDKDLDTASKRRRVSTSVSDNATVVDCADCKANLVCLEHI